MNQIKKWLFPALTCLIVLGAAALPPQISQLRDTQQLGQIHAQMLEAASLPVREPPTLKERLALYARWCTPSETIPSVQRPEMDFALAEARMRSALLQLAEADIIPCSVAEASLESAHLNHVLLWDPTDSMGSQEPIHFWETSAGLGEGAIWMELDAESGLPLRLNIYDSNMAQWLPYNKDPNTLPALAERYFDLLGLEAQQVEPPPFDSSALWNRLYSLDGIGLCYSFSYNVTSLTISLEANDVYTDSDTTSAGYDG